MGVAAWPSGLVMFPCGGRGAHRAVGGPDARAPVRLVHQGPLPLQGGVVGPDDARVTF